MSDRDDFLALMQRFGIPLMTPSEKSLAYERDLAQKQGREPDTSGDTTLHFGDGAYPDEYSDLVSEGRADAVKGYSFVAEWRFDSAGRFVSVGLWE